MYIFIAILVNCLSEETGAKISVTGPTKSFCVYNNPYLLVPMDEDVHHLGAEAFVQFVLDNQNGIDMKKAIESDTRDDVVLRGKEI